MFPRELYDTVGNPTHPLFISNNLIEYRGSSEIPFTRRLSGFLAYIVLKAVFYWRELPKQDALTRTYFGNNMPYLGDLLTELSLILINANPITDSVRPNLPTVIEVQQMYVEDDELLSHVTNISK